MIMEEVLKLLKENNEMLKFIVMKLQNCNESTEVQDFLSNIVANLVANKIDFGGTVR